MTKPEDKESKTTEEIAPPPAAAVGAESIDKTATTAESKAGGGDGNVDAPKDDAANKLELGPKKENEEDPKKEGEDKESKPAATETTDKGDGGDSSNTPVEESKGKGETETDEKKSNPKAPSREKLKKPQDATSIVTRNGKVSLTEDIGYRLSRTKNCRDLISRTNSNQL
jgi:hypothetical protein